MYASKETYITPCMHMHASLEVGMPMHAYMVHASNRQTQVEVVGNLYCHATMDKENQSLIQT